METNRGHAGQAEGNGEQEERGRQGRLPAPEALLADLNEEQQRAVTHGEGPLLVLAGAGSGKTRVITRRIAWLLAMGIPAERILAITFTNKAAQEMRQRVERLIPGHRVWIGTFHAFGVHLLRQFGDRLSLSRSFTIYDVDDRNAFLRATMEAARLDNYRYRPEGIASAISKAKNQLRSPADYARSAVDHFAQVVAEVYPLYERRLRQVQAVDFDDLLYLPALLLREHEQVRSHLDDRYRFILIDEYQDTNLAQYEIVRRLSQDHRNLCVVGDPDQSIYRWRGSDIRNILDFERDFPDARVIHLPRNYRSTGAIVSAANRLIAHNKQRKKKELRTENAWGVPVRVWTFRDGLDEADQVVRRIKETVQAGRFRYRDHAIFVRINALTRVLESAFVRHGVPFQIVKGFAFYERKENKDVLAYLRLLVNPQDDVAFERVVNVPARGIGETTIERLRNLAAERGCSLLAAAAEAGRCTTIKAASARALTQFHRLITELRTRLDLPPHELIDLVLQRSGYEQMLQSSEDPDDQERLANVQELVTAARQFHELNPQAGLTGFLEQVALASDVDGWDHEADRVSVMTLHASKGLEFPVVYILAVEEGLLPHERALRDEAELEEERRLCFVGMTRAMRELHLCHAHLREYRGVIRCAIPSGFLDELPRDQVEWHDLTSTDSNSTRPGDRPIVYAPPPSLPPVPSLPSSSASDLSGSRRGGKSILPPLHRSAANGEAVEGLAPGIVIQHEQFGIGQVVAVSGFGAQQRMKVRFPAHGEKTLLVAQAPFRILNRRSGS
ncbi:MAG: UvrD-helicase domain-containing protein [Thermogemmata sp.]|nr:UvrD-helicase domain-containing protein [Gemmataceae bacterium]